MSLTNPPAIVSQLSTQLAACAGWSGGTANHWYPTVPWASATLPLALLEESSKHNATFAAGAGPLGSGDLKITVHLAQTSDDGTAETLARTLLDQLLSQDTGIAFRAAECGLSGTVSTAEQATDTGTIAVVITLAYGLSL